MEHSGQYGWVDGVSAMRQWSINEGYALVTSVASNTKHGTQRNKGPYDWTGQYSAYGGIPLKMPGEYLAIDAFKAPGPTGLLTDGDVFAGSALVTSVAINWNFTSNEPINHVVQFGGNGALSISTGDGTGYVDASVVNELPPCDAKIGTWVDGAPGTLTRIAHVTQATLTFTREAKSSVNSGTSGGTGVCTTTRQPGAAIDWTFAITTEDGNEVAALATGTVHNFRAFIDATEFWDLRWGILGQRSGLTVDRETGNIIGQTHNAEMRGFDGGVAGNITKPGGVSAWWPAA